MIKIVKISLDEVISVRHPVLRTGKPIESCRFDGDKLSTTFHLGAYINSILVGVVTILYQRNKLLSNERQYQLRGMAVIESYQKMGIGKELVLAAENLVKEKSGSLVWMNARLLAVPFYEKLGYSVFGLKFNIPKVGEHYSMKKTLK